MGKSALRISLPLIISGRTVTDAEPLRERPLFVYDLDLLVGRFPGDKSAVRGLFQWSKPIASAPIRKTHARLIRWEILRVA